MSTGNYDYDNFVRVDCALPVSEFWLNVVHETAHFTLMKQSAYGLFCFFLRQDTRDAQSPLVQCLRRLEQAFECVHECYARTKELLLCTEFPTASQQERQRILRARHSQPYYSRYHMERLEPLLLQYEKVSHSPVFPDFLFLLAAQVDMTPFLETDLTNDSNVQALILANREQLCPDYRLQLLLQSYLCLARRLPPEKITVERLAKESGLVFMPDSAEAMQRFFLKMKQVFSFRPGLEELLKKNMERLRVEGYPFWTAESVTQSFSLSLSDCVIPATLHDRFRFLQIEQPVFRRERNVLAIFMEPEMLQPPACLLKNSLSIGARSAFLRFTNTKTGTHFSDAFAEDLAEFRALLDLYPGVVYLYLDDYVRYHAEGGFRSAPVFFRADVPWNELGAELSTQGATLHRFFLQKYSDSVFFFFGYDLMGNVIFSMQVYWELEKVLSGLQNDALVRCGASDTDCYGTHGWQTFRDLIAAVTEDTQYGELDRTSFERLRIF